MLRPAFWILTLLAFFGFIAGWPAVWIIFLALCAYACHLMDNEMHGRGMR